MCVPDSNYIAEIILFGEGFSDTRLLATKVYTLYQLCAQQLSKQGSNAVTGPVMEVSGCGLV